MNMWVGQGIKMKVWARLGMSLLLLGIVSGECDEVSHKAMRSDFTKCSTRVLHEYNEEMREGTSDGQAATCLLFSKTIDNCGARWSKCHVEQEIRRMKDSLIISMIE